MKPRHHLYLDDALTEELERLARKPGSSKSGIINDALRAYLARGATSEVDTVLKARFFLLGIALILALVAGLLLKKPDHVAADGAH